MGQVGRTKAVVADAARRKLLGRVAALYHRAFQEDPRAKAALAVHGLKSVSMLVGFQAGYANGSLLATIPEDSELQEGLQALGVLDEEGKETLAGCVVIPWFGEGGPEGAVCLGLAGIKDTGEEVYLPHPLEGVWNYQAAKRSKRLIVTDTLLTALRVMEAGFPDVVPLWGKNGLTQDHLGLFQRYGVGEAALAFEASEAVLSALVEEGVTARVVSLPALLEKYEVERTATGFTATWDNRVYRVNGIDKGAVRLRASVKAFARGKEGRFHLDAVDLVSHRGRKQYARDACAVVGLSEEAVLEDLGKLLGVAEEYTVTPQEAVQSPMTEEEKAEALGLLEDPKLMERILSDFAACGLEGEEANKLVGYLAAVSRKLQDPLAVLIQSRSAAGKSTLQEAILRFVPEEDYVKYTRLTGQALFYAEETELCHKLIAIEEEAGARDASYSIRNLQSSKKLTIATTEKDPVSGKMKTVGYEVNGPVALMLTTTAVDMDFETQNRFLTLTIDESKEMTERILAGQREARTLEGLRKRRERERVAKVHRNAQRLLRPLRVVNDLAPELKFPAHTLRARRDHNKYLNLIEAIAYLHQYQREVKTDKDKGEEFPYIEVIACDIEQANRLSARILGQTLDELSAPGRALLEIIRNMVKGNVRKGQAYHFTRREVREAAGWSDFAVKTHLWELVELEYIFTVAGRKGKEYVYELAEAKEPVLEGLVSPDGSSGPTAPSPHGRPQGVERVSPEEGAKAPAQRPVGRLVGPAEAGGVAVQTI